ncbi:hypothetical protein F5Y08DRAFT_8273 [Xylaria arbuscula]|nr:hypothetical protein F5Y08DRAFT_8273 [Xylaria arbuscula]
MLAGIRSRQESVDAAAKHDWMTLGHFQSHRLTSFYRCPLVQGWSCTGKSRSFAARLAALHGDGHNREDSTYAVHHNRMQCTPWRSSRGGSTRLRRSTENQDFLEFKAKPKVLGAGLIRPTLRLAPTSADRNLALASLFSPYSALPDLESVSRVTMPCQFSPVACYQVGKFTSWRWGTLAASLVLGCCRVFTWSRTRGVSTTLERH